MVERRWIIDEAGSVIHSGSADVSASLGVRATATTESYGVDQLGWIGITEYPDRWHIRLRPKAVARMAVSSLCHWLVEREDRPVVISWLDDCWTIERAESTQAAVGVILYLLGARLDEITSGERFKVRRSEKAERLWDALRVVVAPVLNSDTLRPNSHALLDMAFGGRWLIAQVSPSDGEVYMLERGRGIPMFDPMMEGEPRRCSFSTLFDQEYRDRVLPHYVEVCMSGTARFDDIDAMVTWPKYGDVRTRYWRMLIPLQSAQTSGLLFCATGQSLSIDLGPDNVEKARGVFDRVLSAHP